MTDHALSIWSLGLTVLGVLLTFGAIGVSVAIYRRQSSEATGQHNETRNMFKEYVDKLGPGAMRQIANDPGVDGPEEAPAPRAIDRRDGVDMFQPSDIPLRVIADLLAGWSEEQRRRERETGISNIVMALRKPGKGNYAWHVLISYSDGQQRLWKVARGGAGVTGPTVTEVSAVT